MTKTQIARFIVEKYANLDCNRPCILCSGFECACPQHVPIIFREDEQEKCVENIAKVLRNAEKERYGKQEKVTKSCEYCKNSYHEYGTIFCKEHSVQCDGNYIMDISNTKIAEKCKNFEQTNKSCFER